MTSFDIVITPLNNLVTLASAPLPEAISKSYTADLLLVLKVNTDDVVWPINTPILPDDKGLLAGNPPPPYRFNPVPSCGFILEDRVHSMLSESTLGLIIIRA